MASAHGARRDFRRHLNGAWWLVSYLAAVVALSWAGSPQFEGRGYIPYGWDQLCVAVVSLIFYRWGIRSGWRTPALVALEQSEARGPA